MQIFRVMHAVPYSNKQPVKDVIASLHSYFTCNLLIALAVLLSYKTFGGRPIECMLPMSGTSFTGAWEEYAEQFCWSEDTYYVPFNESVEEFTHDQRREKRISYYQVRSCSSRIGELLFLISVDPVLSRKNPALKLVSNVVFSYSKRLASNSLPSFGGTSLVNRVVFLGKSFKEVRNLRNARR